MLGRPEPLALAAFRELLACTSSAEGVGRAPGVIGSAAAGVGPAAESSRSISSSPSRAVGAGGRETGGGAASAARVLIATASTAGLAGGAVTGWAAEDNPEGAGAGQGQFR